MKIVFGAENTFIYLLACIVLAGLITFVIYFKSKEAKGLNGWQSWALVVLRFFSVLLISLLILSPFIKTLKRQVNNPVIITAFDNSLSMIPAGDTAKIKEEILSVYSRLQDGFKGQFTMANYVFGEKATTNRALDFSDKKSDYSKLIDAVYDNHFNENIGAMIIVGDGIYNVGTNPISGAQKLTFPVYSVGFGDTTSVVDAAVTEVRANRNAFTGNLFPVELSLQLEKMPNIPVVVKIFKENTEIFSQRIMAASGDYFTTVALDIKAEKPGLQHYQVQLTAPVAERNRQNNFSQFVINVLENKQKILVLSEGAHPDLGAIKNTLELQQNYEISVFTHEPYPENLSDFNLIVLNQLPSNSPGGGQMIAKALESKIPLLILVGSKTLLPQLSRLNLGIEIIPQAGGNEEAQPIFNPGFEVFKPGEELAAMVEKFPPIHVPFAEINLAPSYSALLFQNLNNIKTQRPLVAMGNLGGRKIGVIFGEGIWRWRLYNYYFNENHNQFNEFVNSVVQYLSLKENEDNFIVGCRQVFYETDPVVMRAEVYNESFAPVNDQEVTITLASQNQEKYPFVFEEDGSFYKLNAGKLPVGNYTFISKVKIGNEEFTETGEFAVLPLNIENVATTANHNVLFQLSDQTGGAFCLPGEVPTLIEEIKNNNNIKPVSYFQASINELLNLKGLFFVLLFVAALEWFLRKFWGIY